MPNGLALICDDKALPLRAGSVMPNGWTLIRGEKVMPNCLPICDDLVMRAWVQVCFHRKTHLRKLEKGLGSRLTSRLARVS